MSPGTGTVARAEGTLHRFDQRPAEAALPRRWPTAREAADTAVGLLVVFNGLRLR